MFCLLFSIYGIIRLTCFDFGVTHPSQEHTNHDTISIYSESVSHLNLHFNIK